MARRAWDDPWNRYPKSVPLPTTDGLATSRQRGAMAGTWWSKRFVDVLESYGLGTRMARGRRYARSGQVLSLEVRAGLLVAQVQGSRRTPYVVTIAALAPSAAQWKKIDGALRARVGFAAQLLAGEVPAELEAVFTAAKTTLLPSSWAQLDATCSCPDPENPCKHIAAVLYLFADRLDADPWLLLEWRGRTRDEILEPLRARAGHDLAAGAAPPAVAAWWPFTELETLPHDPGRRVGAEEDDVVADPADPPAGVLQRCEPLDMTVRGTDVTGLLDAAYDALAHRDA